MYDVVLLSLADTAGAGCSSPRVPVRGCADALAAAGVRAEFATAASDEDLDAVLARLDGPPRPDGLTWPAGDGKTRLVVASGDDAQLRAVVRRLVRRYAPPPSKRPDDLPAARTVPDLPPVGVLPLGPDGGDLATQLGLPRDPAAVAAAVLNGRARRLDLLRNDGGSVTLDGALVGGPGDDGRPRAWRGRVEVDDLVLTDGDEAVGGCVLANAGRYAVIDGLRLVAAPDPTDGLIDVAVAIPTMGGSWLRRRPRIEVRRGRGRAVAVTPRDGEIPYADDGVAGRLGRKRSWWIEPGAWAVYAS